MPSETQLPTPKSIEVDAMAYAPQSLAALRAIREARAAKQRIEDIDIAASEFQLLTAKERNPIKLLKRRKKIKQWLSANNQRDKKFVIQELEIDRGQVAKHQQLAESNFNYELARYRRHISGWDDWGKQRADALLRRHEMSEELLTAYQEQKQVYADIPTIIDWMGHAPTDEKPYGATGEQLEQILEWNINKTHEIAADSDLIPGMGKRYFENLQASVDQGKIHESWLEAVAAVDHIEVGDMLDKHHVGAKNKRYIKGTYYPEEKILLIWPYEDSTVSHESHFAHELTHSLGWFESHWLTEAATEHLSSVIGNTKPLSYGAQRELLDRLQHNSLGDVNDYKLSECFIGYDAKVNEQKFSDLLADIYGGDILGTLNSLCESLAPNAALDSEEHFEALDKMMRVEQVIRGSIAHFKNDASAWSRTYESLMRTIEITENEEEKKLCLAFAQFIKSRST